ncbi:MAG: GNAT family N-acetyltransferase [Synergistaceae bacterium]|nr:GNAT family N-acetyltransferase [Synergistaceae bacterium]
MAKNVAELESERLILRGITEDDAPEIVEWRSDPEAYKFFRSPHRITMDEHLSWYRNNYLSNNNRFDWICVDKSSGRKIGVFGAVRDGNTAEVNYLLAPYAQHKGYALEAVRRIIEYVRSEFHIKRVVAEIHRDNAPSIALAERTGFTLESESGDFLLYSSEE